MFKFIIIPFIFLSSICFSQTNYNTILAPKIDTSQLPIDLRLQKKERLETMGNLFFAAGVISTVIMYNIQPKTTTLFIMPVSLSLSGIIIIGSASKYENE